MPTLGEELRRRREQRGVTLAEISEATRIGTRFLKAIETDSFSTLPGGIFTRSFIRAYARYVGMNEDEAITLYLQQATGQGLDQRGPTEEADSRQPRKPAASPEPVKPAPVEHPRRSEPLTYRQSTPRVSWATIVIGGGIVVFVVLVVLALVKQLNQGAGEPSSQVTSVAQSNTPARSAQQPASSSPGQPVAAPAERPSSPAPPVAEGAPLVVKLEAATGDSWIRYQIDDSKPTVLILKQGQSQDLPPAQSQVTLNYGNRTTLKLKINNREANFPPDTPKFASQVIISRDNFQTYFQ